MLSNIPMPFRSRKLFVTVLVLLIATVLEIAGTLTDAWVNLAVYIVGAYMLGNVGTRAVSETRAGIVAVRSAKLDAEERK